MKVRKNTTTAKATRAFTDREEPRAAFWKKYNETKTDMQQEDSNVRVLNYYGIGGIGKSSLLKKIISEMDEQLSTPRYIYIDLNMCQESRDVLERMKNKLVDNYKFDFPLFELGSYAYAKKVGEKADPVEVKQLTEKSPLLSMMLSAAGEIPVVGIAAKALSFADQGVAYIRTHLKNHNRELKQIEIMEADDLYKYLPYLFSQDMTHNLEKKADEPLVVFFDTYEKLVNELSSVGEPLKNDEWVRSESGLVQNVPNVLWVIAGREKLKWTLFDIEWADALEAHILGNLSFADSDHFLLNAGITDYKLREQLYKLTDGTPVYLDLCVDRFLRILDNGEVPDISMFGKNTFDLIERFVRYMGESQKDLVYMLACLEFWDDTLIDNVAPLVLTNFSFSAYEKAKDYSFIILSENNCYNLHQTVGSVLADNCPKLIKQKVGNALIEQFTKEFEVENYFARDFSKALSYVVQGGLLLHETRENLYDFYEKVVSKNLINLAESGLYEQAKAICERILERAEQNRADLFYAAAIRDSATLFRLSGNYKRAKILANEALNIYLEINGDNHPDTINAMCELSHAYFSLEDNENALNLTRIILKKRKDVLGEEHPLTISTMNNLAVVFDTIGRYSEAQELYQKVLNKRKELLGEDHLETLETMNSIANLYYDLGESEKAIEILNIVLEKRKAILGENHPDVLRVMSSKAVVLDELGEFSDAQQLFQAVIEKSRIIRGEDHPLTLVAIGNLAACLGSNSETKQQSYEMYQTLLEKSKAIHGEKHPQTLWIMHNIAVLLDNLKKHHQASDLFRIVDKDMKCILGEDHPSTIRNLYYFAINLTYLKKYRDALAIYQVVLEKQKVQLGENNIATLETMDKMALLYCKSGEYEKSAEVFRDSIKKRIELYGATKSATEIPMLVMANAFSDAGKHMWVLEIKKYLFEISYKAYGMDSLLTLFAMENMADAYVTVEDYSKAIEIYQNVLKKYCTIYGEEEEEETLLIMKKLASAFSKLKNYKESAELYREILTNAQKIYGEDDPSITEIMNSLASVTYDMRDYNNSYKLYYRVYEKRKIQLGENHASTIISLQNAATSLYNIKEYQRALDFYQIVFEKRRKIYGDKHTKTIDTMNKMISTLEKLGEKTRAADLRNEVRILLES